MQYTEDQFALEKIHRASNWRLLKIAFLSNRERIDRLIVFVESRSCRTDSCWKKRKFPSGVSLHLLILFTVYCVPGSLALDEQELETGKFAERRI